jgi:hypothetical protein
MRASRVQQLGHIFPNAALSVTRRALVAINAVVIIYSRRAAGIVSLLGLGVARLPPETPAIDWKKMASGTL